MSNVSTDPPQIRIRFTQPSFNIAILTAIRNTTSEIVRARVSQAQILRSCLIDLGLVSYPNTGKPYLPPCFVGGIPNQPDPLVSIMDTPGVMFGRDVRTGASVTHAGIKIVVRSTEFLNGYPIVSAISDALDQSMQPFVTRLPEDGSIHYVQNVIRSTPIIDLGEEVGTKRRMWSVNARIALDFREPTIG